VRIKKKIVYFPSFTSLRASAGVGRAGIAPFLVVVMAPQAFANLSISLSLGSSWKSRCQQMFETAIQELLFYYQFKWRWMVYRIYLKHRLVINNLAKESTNKWITSTCGINSVHMESLNWSMEILYFDNKIGEYLENQVRLWLNWTFFIHLTFVFTFDNYLWHKVWVSYETRQEHCSWVAGK